MLPEYEEIAAILAAHPPVLAWDDTRFRVLRQLDSYFMDPAISDPCSPFFIGGPGRVPAMSPLKEFHDVMVMASVESMRSGTSRTETFGLDSDKDAGFGSDFPAMPRWAKIRQFYNMGYVVETSSVSMGFDLVPGVSKFDWAWPPPEGFIETIADALDFLAVTHFLDWYPAHGGQVWHHVDHYNADLVQAMSRRCKPVLLPLGLEGQIDFPGAIFLGNHDSIDIAGCHITAYHGRHVYQSEPHSTPHALYEVITREGIKLFFTGDYDYTTPEKFPYKEDIDILFLHVGGVNPAYDGSGSHDSADGDALLEGLRKYPAKLVVAGHLAELAHPVGGGREGYLTALEIMHRLHHMGLMSRFLIMAWGEVFHFEP